MCEWILKYFHHCTQHHIMRLQINYLSITNKQVGTTDFIVLLFLGLFLILYLCLGGIHQIDHSKSLIWYRSKL